MAAVEGTFTAPRGGDGGFARGAVFNVRDFCVVPGMEFAFFG